MSQVAAAGYNRKNMGKKETQEFHVPSDFTLVHYMLPEQRAQLFSDDKDFQSWRENKGVTAADAKEAAIKNAAEAQKAAEETVAAANSAENADTMKDVQTAAEFMKQATAANYRVVDAAEMVAKFAAHAKETKAVKKAVENAAHAKKQAGEAVTTMRKAYPARRARWITEVCIRAEQSGESSWAPGSCYFCQGTHGKGKCSKQANLPVVDNAVQQKLPLLMFIKNGTAFIDRSAAKKPCNFCVGKLFNSCMRPRGFDEPTFKKLLPKRFHSEEQLRECIEKNKQDTYASRLQQNVTEKKTIAAVLVPKKVDLNIGNHEDFPPLSKSPKPKQEGIWNSIGEDQFNKICDGNIPEEMLKSPVYNQKIIDSPFKYQLKESGNGRITFVASDGWKFLVVKQDDELGVLAKCADGRCYYITNDGDEYTIWANEGVIECYTRDGERDEVIEELVEEIGIPRGFFNGKGHPERRESNKHSNAKQQNHSEEKEKHHDEMHDYYEGDGDYSEEDDLDEDDLDKEGDDYDYDARYSGKKKYKSDQGGW